MHKVLAKMWSQAGAYELAAEHIDQLATLAATAPAGAQERTMSDTTNTDSTWPTGIPEVDAGRLISDCFRDEPANEGEYVMDVRYAVSDRSYSMAYPSEDAAIAALEALTARMGGTMTSSHHGDFTAPGCNTSDAQVTAA